MKKTCLFVLLAVIPLVFFSCSKQSIVPEPEAEVSPLIDPWLSRDISDQVKSLPGPGSIVQAGFEATKTELLASGKVNWKSGDSFKMLAYSGGWIGTTYTTTESGEKVNFTPTGGMPSGVTLHSIYSPLCSVGVGTEDYGFGLKVPAAQTAVDNGVQEGLLYAYAQTNDVSEDMHFKQMLALVRFKMTGAVASSVTSVTLRGASSVAGDCVLVPAADGTPQVTFSRRFGGDTPSPTVTLSGTFAADTYYYFAVVPGTQTGFSLVFSDGVGSTTKISSNSVTFARGKINDIGVIDLGAAFTDPAIPSMETIKWNTATAGATKPVTIAVIPDGFTAAEMPKYEMLAKAAMNTLFNVEPFKSYKNYFNVYIMKVASNASGANITDGHGTITTAVDCYFGSKWGAGENNYGDMAANESTIRAFVSANCPDIDSIHPIEEVPILLIINDSRYGGICHYDSSGFGYCMAPYTFNGGGISWPYPENEAVSDSDPAEGIAATSASRYAEVGSSVGNWLNTMVHEFGGHCFSKLADEYWYNTDKGTAAFIDGHRWDNPPYYGVPMGLNVSATYANPGYDDPGLGEDYIKKGWQHLIDNHPSNPLYSRIGVFQGGHVSILHRWRSERVSCMIDNRFYFSTFQRELIVKRIMSLAGASFNQASFWALDDPRDPVRDIAVSPVMSESNQVPPRPMPMLPPPVFHTDW